MFVARSRFSRPLRLPDEDAARSYVQNPPQRGYHAELPDHAYKWAWHVPLVDTPRRFVVWHVAYPVKHDGAAPPLGGVYEWHTVACPCYAVAATALSIPSVRLVGWARPRRVPGHCAGCGYDLRATPDRCPVCGRAVTEAATV